MKDKVFISMFVVFVLLIYTVNGEDKDLFVKDFGTKKPDNPKLEGVLDRIPVDREHVESLTNGYNVDFKDSSLQVIIELKKFSPQYIEALENAGAIIEISDKNLIQARVLASGLRTIADLSFVNNIHKPQKLRPFVTREGVAEINATYLHSLGFDGSGTKIAVLDLGFEGYPSKLGSELPSSVVTRSFRADGDITGKGDVHGTAVAEIVHDVAPGASLYLVNIATNLEVKNAFDWLIGQKVNIISFSAGKIIGPKDGTDYLDEIVNNATAAGILWVNAAGNGGNTHWMGDFYDPDGNEIHNFAINDETQDIFASNGKEIEVLLDWDDWPYSNQDYDLYILDSSMAVVASSENWQSGTQPPFEAISYTATYTDYYKIVIKKYNATRNVKFHLYSPENPSMQYIVPAGSIAIPGTSTGSLTVGATYWSNDVLEPYSSQGPTDDGRIKPDITAPVGTANSIYGIFRGTSASTPHVSGAAALLLQINPNLSVYQLKQAIESGSKDLGTPGKDNQYGAGRVNIYESALPFFAKTMMLSIGNDSLKIGKEATVSVRISNASDISGGFVKVLFDPGVVDVLSAMPGDFGDLKVDINNSTGCVVVSKVGTTAIGKNEALFVNITFRGRSQGSTPLTLTDVELNKKDGSIITPVTRDGLLTVIGVRGDVNRNVRLDTGDATLILRNIVGLSIDQKYLPILPEGDMNCNEKIDTGDATLILRDVVGLPVQRCWE